MMKIPQTVSSTAANLKSAGYSYELEKQVSPLNTSYKQVMQKGGLHEPITYSFTTADNSKWLLKLAPAKGWRYNKWNWFIGYIVIIDFKPTKRPIADCLADMEKYVFPEVNKD